MAALLRDAPLDPHAVAELVRGGTVLMLCDVALPPAAPPVGAVAFRVDERTRTAELAGVGVASAWRGRGLGRRLVTSALTALRAAGMERVHAWARAESPAAALLAGSGFVADNGTADSAGRSRFLLSL